MSLKIEQTKSCPSFFLARHFLRTEHIRVFKELDSEESQER